jgi:hydrophobe/amphiphile efflux-1 (HAE1) family protein
MSRFFIERPIFAWVIAIVTMLAGGLAIMSLPIAQYPSIAPPAVSVTATYPGADADTLESAVTQVIEQQFTGLDHLLYFSSTSESDGQVTITATFAAGTNPDTAQVQVQNKVQQATPLLPQEVQTQGITVQKSQSTFLMIMTLYDDTGHYSSGDLSDYVSSHLQDPISRVNGVGDIRLFGAQHAIRIWLDPYKLNNYKLTVSDIRTAVSAQNIQVSAGQIGAAPSVAGQELNATVTVQSRLRTASQFRDIILRTESNGSTVRLSDVARVEMGSDSYDVIGRYNGYPGTAMGVKLAPGANALSAVNAVKSRIDELAANFPAGVKLAYPVDNTTFIKLSIKDVVKTLFEAIALVVIVIFIFLQNWRATLIPTIAVPVVLLGAFGVLAVAGYSINTLTLFALVLAIGLLVDDAIVVVENVQRLMDDEGLSPKDATIKSMGEITGALVGITTVLSAVFLPMAFFSGSTGVIYRQFSVTIIAAMVLSVIVALVLTPALCATLLKPTVKRQAEPAANAAPKRGFFVWFNRNFDGLIRRYDSGLRTVLKRSLPALCVYAGLLALMALLFLRLPSGFLPDEDQGTMFVQFTLPSGAVQSRSVDVIKQVEHHLLVDEKANVDGLFAVSGFSFGGSGQNVGVAFAKLRDWKERNGSKNRAPAIAARAMGAFAQIRDAQVFAFIPPAVQELGNANGFDFELEDQGGLGHDALVKARNQLLGLAAKDPKLTAVRPNGQEDTPQLHVDVDLARAGALGLSQGDISDTLSTAWGSSYINQFNDQGRVKRVYMQGDSQFRMAPDDLKRWYVRTSSGSMSPFSAFSDTRWTNGPSRLERYNGQPAMEILGQSAPGYSSGTAIAEMKKLAAQLPAGIGFEWTGLSYQEQLSGSQGPMLYAISIIVVFLCLAALFESWAIPFAVLLIIPLGIVGAVLAATFRGLYNDIYFQVGLLTTMGLAAKNAILIAEFADAAVKTGASLKDAASQAAKLRLRPILMTSLAFVAGVTPLALSTGAGAGSQTDIGTGVIGGMLSATIFGIFFAPLFFVLLSGLATRRAREPSVPTPAAEHSA